MPKGGGQSESRMQRRACRPLADPIRTTSPGMPFTLQMILSMNGTETARRARKAPIPANFMVNDIAL